MTGLPSKVAFCDLPSAFVARLTALNAFSRRDPRTCALRSKLHARLSPADELSSSENYQVDLARAELTYAIGERPVSFCEVQLMGTWSAGAWLWGWDNPAIPHVASHMLKNELAGQQSREMIGTIPHFEVDQDAIGFAVDVLAQRCGFLGCYRVPVDEGVAMLATRVRLDRDWAFDDPRNDWCLLNGIPRNAPNTRFISCSFGNISEDALQVGFDVLDVHVELGNSVETGVVNTAMPPCLLSNTYQPRFFTRFSALSYAELVIVRERLVRVAGV